MMDPKRTKAYYEALTPDDICQCARCRNYMEQIRSSYPLVADSLQSMGVDIEKPFETMPLEPDGDGYIQYVGPQYVVLGSAENFRKTEIAGVCIDIAESHPPVDLSEAHFVVELYPIRLKWTMPHRRKPG